MKVDHPYINPRQDQGNNHGGEAQHPDESPDGQRLKVIVRRLQEHGQLGGNDEGKGASAGHDRQPPFQQRPGDLVRPFGAESYGKRRIRIIFNKIFNVTCSKNRVDIDLLQPGAHFADQLIPGQPLEVEQGYLGAAEPAQGHGFDPELGDGEAEPDQGGVDLQVFHEAVARPADGDLVVRFAHFSDFRAACIADQRARAAIEKESGSAAGNGGEEIGEIIYADNLI